MVCGITVFVLEKIFLQNRCSPKSEQLILKMAFLLTKLLSLINAQPKPIYPFSQKDGLTEAVSVLNI